MEIHFTIKCLVVIGFLFVCNVETENLISIDEGIFYDLNNSQTIVVESPSTWSSWFRDTYIDQRLNPEYVIKFKGDNTLMFVVDARDAHVMFLLDSNGKQVAEILLDGPPHYVIRIERSVWRYLFVDSSSFIRLDEFEDDFKENSYKSFYSNALQFDISFIDGKTRTLDEIEKLDKVCAVRFPILTWESCDSPYSLSVNTASLLPSLSLDTYIKNNIYFCIITSLTDEKIIKFDEIDELQNSKFDPESDTVVVIHGYQADPFDVGHSFIESYRDAYFGDGTRRLNLIGIEWTNLNTYNYMLTAQYSIFTGHVVGEFLYLAIQRKLIRPKDLYLVGHSLGAHMAGFIGKSMQRISDNNVKPARITALDPAGPYFFRTPCTGKVCETDADWVEAFHSSYGFIGLGLEDRVGNADYYLNGGYTQPGCWFVDLVCHHSYAHQFHRKMLTHQEQVNAWRCVNLYQMEVQGKCELPRNPITFWGVVPPMKCGVFYVSYPAIVESDIPVESEPRHISFTPMSKKKPKTIVLFGANHHNVHFLAGLLSANPDLHVRQGQADNFNILIDPQNYRWKPPDEYHMNFKTQSNEIMSYLNTLPKPMRFVLTVDYNDLFRKDFWTLIGFIAEDKTYHNELVVVAMNMPYVEGTQDKHVEEIEKIIQHRNSKHRNPNGFLGSFKIRGLHEITKSARITEIPNLMRELHAIKSIVDLH